MPLIRRAVVSLLLLVGCGESHTKTRAHDAGTGGRNADAGHATADASPRVPAHDSGTGGRNADATVDAGHRVPAHHRATDSSCPVQRGPGDDASACNTSNRDLQCLSDADCTKGTRGRCLFHGPMACQAACSYDVCASDSDCASNQPCQCRTSKSSAAPNWCVGGSNCRVDSDCGAGGYCSPSPTRACDDPSSCLQYFCHTAQDSCMDDSDCEGDDNCTYDAVSKLWSCRYVF